MMDLVLMIKNSGIWGMTQVMSTVIAFLCISFWSFLLLRKKSLSTVLLLPFLLLPTLIGIIAFKSGISIVNEAAIMASPENKQSMMAHGLSIATYTQIFPVFMLVGLFVGLIICALNTLLQGSRKWTNVLIPLGVTFFCVLLLIIDYFRAFGASYAGGYILGMSMILSFGSFSALAFTSTKDDLDAVEGSFAGALMTSIAFGLFFTAFRAYDCIQLFEVIALTSPEYRSELIEKGLEMINGSKIIFCTLILVSFIYPLIVAFRLPPIRKAFGFVSLFVTLLLILGNFLFVDPTHEISLLVSMKVETLIE